MSAAGERLEVYRMGLAEVSDILWRERELLDVLLFKLEEEHLLLATGKSRWLPRATREVELVIEQLRLTELTRAMEVDAAAAALGLAAGPSLAALADAAPSPWRDLLRAHREAFLRLTHEITALADASREFMTAAHLSAEEMLRGLHGVAVDGSITPSGRTKVRTPGGSFLGGVQQRG